MSRHHTPAKGTFSSISYPTAEQWADNIGVMCGSRIGNSPDYVREARRLGGGLIRASKRIVYGGGDVGLMGAMSDGALGALGQAAWRDEQEKRIYSVNPKFFLKVAKGSSPDVHEKVVDDMFDRKREFLKLCTLFVFLPGGIGTLDEFFEIMAAADIMASSEPDRPTPQSVLVDVNGFYSRMMPVIQEVLVGEGFAVADRFEQLVHFAPDAKAAIRKINELSGKAPLMPANLKAKVDAANSDYRLVLGRQS